MKQLTLADEILVLMLRDDTGEIKRECTNVANVAIAGGILMELSLLGKIDSDMTSLFVIDRNPTGDDLLDEALEKIAAEPKTWPSAWWIERLGDRRENLVQRVLDRLVQAGILRVENRRYLWVFSRRAYPQNTGREEREAKARLISIIRNNELPDPRDTLLLSLAESSDVLSSVLPPEEVHKAKSRVAEVIALEEIGRSVQAVASNLRAALLAAASARFG
jgi:Golgi phosphoprotein 3